mgnify:CR=1 FL=1
MQKSIGMIFAAILFAINITASIGCASEPSPRQTENASASTELGQPAKIIHAEQTIYDEDISYQGRVALAARIGTDGQIVSTRIMFSSGNMQYDRMARQCVVEKWRFTPALDANGTPMVCDMMCVIYFNMEPTRRIE